MRKYLLAISVTASALSCGTSKQTAQAPLPAPAPTTETVEAPTLEELIAELPPEDTTNYELPVYRAAQSQPFDLTHTRLRVRFDWEKEQVIGQATVRMQPTFHPQRTVAVDAKGFEFKQVALGETTKRPLQYTANDSTVIVSLDREYKRGEQVELYFDYVATPSASGEAGAAITSDKGLFFINPRGEEGPDKPRQIWTQGETEYNSRWMPTFDQPNERSTQEFWITVDDKYETLSNGLMISSNKNADGTRTDYWRMDQPHAPYLHMLAVGEFAKVDDRWRNVPLSYYVEPEYEAYAKTIFDHTPEMLEFFSQTLGVDYPWPKYSQIIVRDYVSGAMENTTAVIFGEFVQKTDRELADDNNDLIVAHEMFHHWFGDYVTTEAWSNLTLNEGFANYSEYLWFEHHDGKAAAEEHRMTELQGYLGSGRRGGFHPLIWYGHSSPIGEDMFDAHSYNKGGLVLHMLREQIGDEAFFASLKKYLQDNKFSAVEVDELRMAFEDTIGEDLQWFFDQWFLGNGHPEFAVSYGYADGTATVTVEQRQDVEEFRPVFRLPTQIGHYPAAGGAPVMHDVEVTKRRQTFSFPAAEGDLFVFDPRSTILGLREEDRSPADRVKIFERVGETQQELIAIREIREAAEKSNFKVPSSVAAMALQSESFRIQNNGIALSDASNPATVKELRRIAREAPTSSVRSSALAKLGESNDEALEELYREVLSKDQSYGVMSSGLQGLFKVNPSAGAAAAAKLESSANDDLLVGVATIYATQGDQSKLGFFEEKLATVDNQQAGEFAGAYIGLAMQGGLASTQKAIDRLGELALDQKTSLYRRYSFTSALAELRSLADNPALKEDLDGVDIAPMITEKIEAIKAAETNPQLQAAFMGM